MVTYKSIRTKRGTRYVKVLPSGQYRFVKKAVYERAKGLKRTVKRKVSRAKTKVKRVAKRRRYRKKRKAAKKRIPLVPTIALIGVLYKQWQLHRAGEDITWNVMKAFTGIDIQDGTFDYKRMYWGTLPIALSGLVSKLLSKFRLQPNIPYVRL